jgi:hypothetical protein
MQLILPQANPAIRHLDQNRAASCAAERRDPCIPAFAVAFAVVVAFAVAFAFAVAVAFAFAVAFAVAVAPEIGLGFSPGIQSHPDPGL